MPNGRPREHDRDKIALDLIEWAKLESSINFNKFCCTREPPIPATKLLLWSKEDEIFRMAYETAKAFLGSRREEWLSSNKLHVKAYDLNANVYDLIAKDEKMANAQFESSLRKDEDNKHAVINVYTSPEGLASGLKLPTATISTSNNNSSE